MNEPRIPDGPGAWEEMNDVVVIVSGPIAAGLVVLLGWLHGTSWQRIGALAYVFFLFAPFVGVSLYCLAGSDDD